MYFQTLLPKATHVKMSAFVILMRLDLLISPSCVSCSLWLHTANLIVSYWATFCKLLKSKGRMQFT